MHQATPELSRVEALQLIALGAILANKELRKEVRPSMFSFYDFQCAFDEINKGHRYARLSEILQGRCNVPWEPSRDSPIPAILKALERDGEYLLHVSAIKSLIEDTCDPQSFEFRKDEFCGRAANIKDAVEFLRESIDKPQAAITRNEQRLQNLPSALTQGGPQPKEDRK